jgi:large subunit ribosomal protein L13
MKNVDKTYIPKANEVEENWYLVDANGRNLGRMASEIAAVLLGKHKPTFTPGMDTGDHVIVVNCERIQVTGNKLTEKFYYRYSLYPSGLTTTSLQEQLKKHPDRVITHAVWGMLPHNKYGRQIIKKLKVYAGPDHPHAAQQPKPMAFGKE